MTQTQNPRLAAASNPAVWPATITSAVLVAQLIASKATRDALFLTHFELAQLPSAMIAAAILSGLSVLAITRALSTAGPARVLPASFAASALLFVAAGLISVQSERAAAIAIYAHGAIINLAIGSAFWSLVNERFDPHTARRLVGRIAGGGTAGGVVGGALVWVTSFYRSTPAMLVVLATMSAIGLWSSIRFTRRAPKLAAQPAPIATSGFTVLRQTPYLRDVALLAATAAATQALLDWLFNAHASRAYEGHALLSFFAAFNVGVNVLSFLAQVLLTRWVLEKRGLGGAIQAQSAGVAAAVLAAVIAPVFGTVIVARVVEQVARSSLYRSAYELFFTPLPSEKKRPTKMILDVGFDRIGTALASAGLFGLAQIGTSLAAQPQLELQTRVTLAFVLALSAAAIYVAIRLQRGYVAALASSLKSGAITLAVEDAQDLITRRTLAETSALIDREKLLAQIAEHQARISNRPDVTPSPSDIAERLTALGSAEPTIARDAARALRPMATNITDLLLDRLLDGRVEARIRRRIPTILQASHTQRAVDGLVRALHDPALEVRTEVALALGELVHGSTAGLQIDREPVLQAVRYELASDRSLAHVFVLLGLVIEHEPLSIAHRALGAAEPALRGTALEYLEVVLPPDVRDALMPLLGDVKAPPRSRRRGQKELADELLRSKG